MSNLSAVGYKVGNNTTDNITDLGLMSLDDYLSTILPAHFQKYFLEDLESYRQHSPSENLDHLINSIKLGNYNELPLHNNFSHQYERLKSLSSKSTFSSLSFTQGLIIGQLSVIIILAFSIKFFIFNEGSSRDKNPPVISSLKNVRGISNILKRGGKNRSELQSSILANDDDSENEMTQQINNILQKTYYDVNTHKYESLDWFNVLIAQIIQQFREEAYNKNNILNSFNEFIENNSNSLPDYLDSIKVTELDIGDDFPIFSNCRINNEKKKLEAKIDIDLIDRVSLGIRTKLLLNYPKSGFMALPINLTVAIIRFQGCLTVSLTKANEFVYTDSKNDSDSNLEKEEDEEEEEEEEDNRYFLMFSFSPEYKFEFDTQSLIGARSKLENIPRIRSLIEYQIKKWFVERCVEPRFQFVKLPNIWPRSKNTREEKHDDDKSPRNGQ